MTELDPSDSAAAIAKGLVDLSFIAAQLGQAPDKVDLDKILTDPAFGQMSLSRSFDCSAYLECYPDVQDFGLHPVIHYLRHGRSEKRFAYPDFASALAALQPAQKPIWLESHDLGFTGAPIALLHILQGLRDFGGRVQLAAPIDGPLAPSFSEITGPIILHGQAAQRVQAQTDFSKMQQRCISLLQKSGAAHVIGNSFMAWPMVWAARQLGLPTTWIIHEPDTQEMADQFPPDIFGTLMGLVAQVDKLIFVSPASRTAWGADHNPRAEVIPKALPPADPMSRDVGRKAAGCAADDVLILSVGTASPRKGQSDLVAALEHLADQGAADHLVTVLVGYVDTPYANDLRDRLKVLRDRGLRLLFLRQSETVQERSRVEYLFAAADIFIMSSRAESLPLTTAEALAAGCPVISTDAPGIAEMVTNGKTGLLYTAGDSQTLAQHIRHLAETPALRAQMRSNIAAQSNGQAYPDMIAAYRKAIAQMAPNLDFGVSTAANGAVTGL